MKMTEMKISISDGYERYENDEWGTLYEKAQFYIQYHALIVMIVFARMLEW